MKDFCIILMFDRKFLKKSHETIRQIRTVGQYKGDIVCILADNVSEELCYHGANVILKHFPQYSTDSILQQQELAKDCFPMRRKMIHYHKFYCFHTWFKENYKKCFYIDTGTQILKPLDKMINLECKGLLLAHSNAYPDYNDTLSCQFDRRMYPDLYAELERSYNLNVDHFQATILLYDTSIIENETFDTLMELAYKYVNSKTNDQAIMNLYFNCMRGIWKQIPVKDEETHYYDFYMREPLTQKDYIMIKYLQR